MCSKGHISENRGRRMEEHHVRGINYLYALLDPFISTFLSALHICALLSAINTKHAGKAPGKCLTIVGEKERAAEGGGLGRGESSCDNCWFCQFSLSLIFDHNNLMCALCAGKRLKYHIMNTISLPEQPVSSPKNSKYIHNCHCVAFDLIFMPRRHLFYGFIMWGRVLSGIRMPKQQLAINWECFQKPQTEFDKKNYVCPD